MTARLNQPECHRGMIGGEGTHTVDLELWPETLEWIEAYHRELGIAQMPGALIVRTRRGRPFTKDILAKDIRQVREKLGIPSELKLSDLRRTA